MRKSSKQPPVFKREPTVFNDEPTGKPILTVYPSLIVSVAIGSGSCPPEKMKALGSILKECYEAYIEFRQTLGRGLSSLTLFDDGTFIADWKG